MDQSKLIEKNNTEIKDPNTDKSAPKQQIKYSVSKLNIEFFVGLFAIAAIICGGYLAVGLGGLEIGKTDYYKINAQFDNISGLKFGAAVEIAGVSIGEVEKIALDENQNFAVVTLKIKKNVQLRDDDIASIRTKGIIGDKYVKISRGASDEFIAENGTLTETESVVDIEDIIGKIIHSLGGDKKDEE